MPPQPPQDTTNECCRYVLVRGMSRHHFSLHELAPNHNKNQIDNTGNVVVWDAEKPLTWALNEELQEQLVLRKTSKSTVPTDPDKHQTREFLPLLSPSQTPEPDATTTTPMVLGTVLKLGAGMAGLAALSLGPYAHRIVWTDGHLYRVQSNRVSVHLTRAWQATTTMAMDHDTVSSSWPNRDSGRLVDNNRGCCSIYPVVWCQSPQARDQRTITVSSKNLWLKRGPVLYTKRGKFAVWVASSSSTVRTPSNILQVVSTTAQKE